MDYKNLHWESIAFLKEHLYQRLTSPLNKALSYLELTESKTGNPANARYTTDAQRNLEILMTLIKSWSILVEWKYKGSIAEAEFQALEPTKFPDWLLDELREQAILRFEHSRTLKVQHETFCEGMILLVTVAKALGEISHIMSNDAEDPQTGVWMRVVFKPYKSDGFQSRSAIVEHLSFNDPLMQQLAIQFAVADDLFALNNARFSLQKNTRTGHQAFAMLVAVTADSQNTAPKFPEPPLSSILIQAGPTLFAPSSIVAEAAALSTPPLSETPPIVEIAPIVAQPENAIGETPIDPFASVTMGSTPTMTDEKPLDLEDVSPVTDAKPLGVPAAKKVTLLEIVKRTESVESNDLGDFPDGDKSETLIIKTIKPTGINMTPPSPLTLHTPVEEEASQSVILKSIKSSPGILTQALLALQAEAETPTKDGAEGEGKREISDMQAGGEKSDMPPSSESSQSNA